MEKLSLKDRQQGGSIPPNAVATPPPGPPIAPQLPPQMFTTAAQLLDLTDKKLMVVLRDGRKLTGVLRSWDQFANLVLQNTLERIYAQNLYADIKHGPGLYIVRGENVLLLGEIDLDQEEYVPEPYKEAPEEQVKELLKQENEKRKKKDKSRVKLLYAHGFEGDLIGDNIL